MKFLLTLTAVLALAPLQVRAGDTSVTAELKVPAMKCVGCAWSVTESLKKVENVTAVYVDPKSKTALVEVVSKQSPGKKALYAAVKKSGYEGSGYRIISQSFAAAKADLEN